MNYFQQCAFARAGGLVSPVGDGRLALTKLDRCGIRTGDDSGAHGIVVPSLAHLPDEGVFVARVVDVVVPGEGVVIPRSPSTTWAYAGLPPERRLPRSTP
ncbi:hypothetical protein [Nocardia panacis]|uniref:hypothetical protein n=1 Tax=Nocardia panacis TaxID=2340916 RepID=UPI0011C36957|nr:hypothetical protein [Nocardia panacis]